MPTCGPQRCSASRTSGGGIGSSRSWSAASTSATLATGSPKRTREPGHRARSCTSTRCPSSATGRSTGWRWRRSPVPEPHVYSIPMRTRFRGIDVREGVLLRGAAGWGEFSPFLEYDDRVAEPWLCAALEAADQGWPEPRRTTVPVNVTVPAVGPEQAAEIVRANNGCRTAKVKVAEPGQSLAEEQARLEAGPDALRPPRRGRRGATGPWAPHRAGP